MMTMMMSSIKLTLTGKLKFNCDVTADKSDCKTFETLTTQPFLQQSQQQRTHVTKHTRLVLKELAKRE